MWPEQRHSSGPCEFKEYMSYHRAEGPNLTVRRGSTSIIDMLRSRAHLGQLLGRQCICRSTGSLAPVPPGLPQSDPPCPASSLPPQASSSAPASASAPAPGHCQACPASQAGNPAGPHRPAEAPHPFCHSCLSLLLAPAVNGTLRSPRRSSHLSLSPIPQLSPKGSHLAPPLPSHPQHPCLSAWSCPVSPRTPLSPQSPPLPAQAPPPSSSRSLSDCSDLSLLHQRLQHIINRRPSSPIMPDRGGLGGLGGFMGSQPSLNLSSSHSEGNVYSLPVPRGHVTTSQQQSPLPSPPSPPRGQGRSGHLVGFFFLVLGGVLFVALTSPQPPAGLCCCRAPSVPESEQQNSNSSTLA